MNTKHAIILAAGYGSRLKANEGHKLLANISGRPMLAYHIDNFRRLHIRDITIVTGFADQKLREAIQSMALPDEITLRFAYNPTFDGENGTSLLAGTDLLYRHIGPVPFWLTMSDHLFSPRLFDDLYENFSPELPPNCGGSLIVDKKLDTIFDMPDATKVNTDGASLEIGKDLSDFDLVDAGLFWCTPDFVKAMEEEKERRGDCSTSDGVRRLYDKDRFYFWDLKNHLWQDVDTPEAREHAEKLIARDFRLS